MADYYPLIAKAVTGLEKSTGEARRALYDRARTALLAQLRGVEPALAEPDITRERLALEEAIRKVEAEAARRSRNDPLPPRPEPPRPEPPLRAARQATIAPPAEAVEARPASVPARPAAALSAAGGKPSAAPRQPSTYSLPLAEEAGEESRAEAAGSAAPNPQPPQAERQRWSRGGGPSISDKGLRGFRDVVAEAETLGSATAQAAKNARAAYQAVPAPGPDLERVERRSEPRVEKRTDARPGPRAEARVERRTEPRVEPPPPRPPQRRPSPRDAEKLLGREPVIEPGRQAREPKRSRDAEPPRPASRRPEPPLPIDEPEDLPEADDTARDLDVGPAVKPEYPTRPPSSMVRQEDARPRTPVAPRAAKPERKPAAAKRPPRPWKKLIALSVATLLILAVAAIGIWQRQQVIALFRSTPGFNRTADSAAPGDSGARPKIADRIGSAPFTGQGSNEGALVAQKAVLYEEDQNDPSGRRFVGSAVWRTDRAPAGPGQSPEVAIRADIEIPEQRIGIRWSLRRNEDKSLPASHTVEIMFTLPADFPHGGITNIPGVLMKQGESTRGVPLAGLAVKVTTNFFLIGLSSVDADMQRNLQLLKERGWFDIPVVYGDGQRAIIAIEKGTPGERVFAEAFAAWGG